MLFWGKYVAHDNNRDGLGMALALSRNQMKTFLDYHPPMLHDLHESVPFLYTIDRHGTVQRLARSDRDRRVAAARLSRDRRDDETRCAWRLDPWVLRRLGAELHVLCGASATTRSAVSTKHLATAAPTRANELSDRTDTSRQWFRPNPPLPRVNWSIRNNINLQQSGLLLAMNFVAKDKDRFLNNFYLKSKRAIGKAANEGPQAYVIPGDTPRPVEAADMVNLLRLMGVEVHTANKEITIKDQKFPAGTYVIRMDQPYSRMADMLLDTQYYNVDRSAAVRRYRLDARRAAQRQDRAGDRQDCSSSRRAHDADHERCESAR